MRGKGALKAASLVLALVVAAACAVMLVDPLGWLSRDSGEAPAPTAFPGVGEPPIVPACEPVSTEPFNVLILGIDHGLDRPAEGNERSDTIIVAHINEAESRACLLSIPRDSYVNIPGYGTSKINEAYQVGGIELAVKTVERVTGMEIRNHVVVNFDEFIWLVDLFGGVQVTLSEAISDPLLGNIPAGNQFLDGANALIMARSRDYPQGDLERVRQQQRLLIQALYKGKELSAYPGAAWFLSAAIEPLESDFTRDELIRLARAFAAFPVVDVQGAVAPGRIGSVGSASVYLLDEAELRALVSSIEEACFVPERFR